MTISREYFNCLHICLRPQLPKEKGLLWLSFFIGNTDTVNNNEKVQKKTLQKGIFLPILSSAISYSSSWAMLLLFSFVCFQGCSVGIQTYLHGTFLFILFFLISEVAYYTTPCCFHFLYLGSHLSHPGLVHSCWWLPSIPWCGEGMWDRKAPTHVCWIDGGFLCCSRHLRHVALSVQFSSVQSLTCVQFFATPWTATSQASLSITNSRSLLRLMSVELVIPSNHLIFCHSLLLLPSIFPSIRVFSNESTFHIRWPKYWNFSFIISPSNEYWELISFRIDWFDLWC